MKRKLITSIQIAIIAIVVASLPFADCQAGKIPTILHPKIVDMWAYGDIVTDSTILKTEQNNLRFYCGTMEGLPADSLDYDVMLEGYDEEWHGVFKGGYYGYMNLPPGDYVFMARCRYNGGEWGPILKHPFTIDCPWWRTTWAHIIYIILVCSLLLYIFSLTRSRMRYKNELNIERAMLKLRTDLVIQASRDIRTPLSAIRSIAERYTLNSEEQLSKTDIQHLKHSSRQLLQMVENLVEMQPAGQIQPLQDGNDVIEMTDVPINQLNVMVVEPDKLLADVIMRELHKYVNVSLAFENDDIIQSALELQPDAIVIDSAMKKLNTYELMHELRKKLNTCIILISDFDNKRSIIRAIRSEADDYMAKPINCEVLAALVIKRIKEARNTFESKAKLMEHTSDANLPLTNKDVNTTPIFEKRADKLFLERMDTIIFQNISNPDFDINTLADAMKISRSKLGKKIKELRGVSPLEYLRNRRLDHAASLLLNSDMTIQEVMYGIGMSDATNFHKRFKEKFGSTPTEYRNQ